jgi:D-3-phosphoglycerate dehydrogenase
MGTTLSRRERPGARHVVAFRHHGVAALSDDIVQGLRERGCQVTQVPDISALDNAGVDFDSVGALVVSTRIPCSREFLERFPSLSGVVYVAIGTESIDLRDAAALNLVVAYGATSENSESMSEATVLLMLALLYDLRRTEQLLAENAPRPAMPSAKMLKHKTIGLAGFGRIARGVVSRLANWDVDILVASLSSKQEDMPENCRLCSLSDLLVQSDLVSLHASVNEQTRGMIGRAELALMKPSAYLLNTARGALVDEDALAEALIARTIAGAALDTFAIEPLPVASPLRGLSNVILTPHLVGHTREAINSLVSTGIENTLCILDGRAPVAIRNPEQLEAWLRR